jgi:hypothetical protein
MVATRCRSSGGVPSGSSRHDSALSLSLSTDGNDELAAQLRG